MFPVNGLDMCRHVQKMSGTDRRADDGGSSGFGNSRHGSTSPPSRGSSTSSVSAWLTWKPGRKIPDTVNDYIYDLFAVCNHYGNMQGGHYTGTSIYLAVMWFSPCKLAYSV
jgi:Ubiquitin carboxyl-terminal hydrolase